MKVINKVLLFFVTVFAFSAHAGLAQPTIAFDKNLHDFGRIQATEGIVEHRFEFENKGDEHLVISKVNTTCGCTSPDWSNEEIKPGERGYVTASYNPENRSGSFTESIYVYHNGQGRRHRLRVKGEVIPEEKDVTTTHPHEFGSLRSRTPNFFAGHLDDATADGEGRVRFLNTSNKSVTVRSAMTPTFIEFKDLPVTIAPGRELYIYFNYDATQHDEYGFVYDRVILQTDDPKGADKEFNISARILPNTDDVDPENAPELTFEKETHNFGNVLQGDEPETRFEFTNTGESTLRILRIMPNCGCTASDPEKSVLEPGESSYITVSYNTAGRVGPNTERVRVYSNDPSGTVKEIEVYAYVVEEE